MADPAEFLDDENWHGGYHELAIDLGERNTTDGDVRLPAALRTLWSDPALTGCYLGRWQPRSAQTPITPPASNLDEPAALCGVAKLPSGMSLLCVTHVVREIDD